MSLLYPMLCPCNLAVLIVSYIMSCCILAVIIVSYIMSCPSPSCRYWSLCCVLLVPYMSLCEVSFLFGERLTPFPYPTCHSCILYVLTCSLFSAFSSMRLSGPFPLSYLLLPAKRQRQTETQRESETETERDKQTDRQGE